MNASKGYVERLAEAETLDFDLVGDITPSLFGAVLNTYFRRPLAAHQADYKGYANLLCSVCAFPKRILDRMSQQDLPPSAIKRDHALVAWIVNAVDGIANLANSWTPTMREIIKAESGLSMRVIDIIGDTNHNHGLDRIRQERGPHRQNQTPKRLSRLPLDEIFARNPQFRERVIHSFAYPYKFEDQPKTFDNGWYLEPARLLQDDLINLPKHLAISLTVNFPIPDIKGTYSEPFKGDSQISNPEVARFKEIARQDNYRIMDLIRECVPDYDAALANRQLN